MGFCSPGGRSATRCRRSRGRYSWFSRCPRKELRALLGYVCFSIYASRTLPVFLRRTLPLSSSDSVTCSCSMPASIKELRVVCKVLDPNRVYQCFFLHKALH